MVNEGRLCFILRVKDQLLRRWVWLEGRDRRRRRVYGGKLHNMKNLAASVDGEPLF